MIAAPPLSVPHYPQVIGYTPPVSEHDFDQKYPGQSLDAFSTAFMQHQQHGFRAADGASTAPSMSMYNQTQSQSQRRPQPPLHTLQPTPTPPNHFPPTPVEPTSGPSHGYLGASGTQQWVAEQGYGHPDRDREMRSASGSITPPAGASTTPPHPSHHHQQQQQHYTHEQPQRSYSRQGQGGEMYTPASAGPGQSHSHSHYITPAQHIAHMQHHAHTIDSSSMLSSSAGRPQLATSLSFPGSMYTQGTILVTPPSASMTYPASSSSALASSYGQHPGYHFGSMAPPPLPSQYAAQPTAGAYAQHHQMAYQNGHAYPPGMMLPTPLQMPTDDWGSYAEWEDDEHPGEWFGGNMEVKHRRRTSPEQLKVLEHWFSINPKPDNALREWLAGELGMTKRNVQVWFQNRRAKIKGLQIKERVAMEKAVKDAEGQRTPEGQISLAHPPPPMLNMPHPFPRELRERAELEAMDRASASGYASVLVPPVPPISERNLTIPMPGPLPNGGRRVSLANGEADRIQMWAAKRAATSGVATGPSPRSPSLGQAAAARRGSIPYPTPLSSGFAEGVTAAGRSVSGPGASPKFSPLVRPTPSTLHLTAIRNNTRRASMPGAPQLLSSGPFTPPRVISSNYPMASLPGRATRELSPITDHDNESSLPHALAQPPAFLLSDSDFGTTFLTPPHSTYNPAGGTGISPASISTSISSGLGSGGSAGYGYPPLSSEPYTPLGPLPDASFSFGNNALFEDLGLGTNGAQSEEEVKRAQAIYLSMQERGRLGSLASINTWTTDETAGTAEEGDAGSGGESGFGFGASRRASAPAELLENLGMLGIGAYANFGNTGGAPLRPSPLGMNNGFTSTSATADGRSQAALYSTAGYSSSGQPQLSIPIHHVSGSGSSPGSAGSGSGMDHSPGSFVTTSPIDLPGPTGATSMPMSAQTSYNSSTSPTSHTSVHSLDHGMTLGQHSRDPMQYRSLSTGHVPPSSLSLGHQAGQLDASVLSFGASSDLSNYDFGLHPSASANDDDDADSFSILVPPMTVSVSAPASAYPGTMGEHRHAQASLGAAADISGNKKLATSAGTGAAERAGA